MKFGLLLTAVHDASVPGAQQVAEHRELVRAADELGFDVMVCGQHFLGTELRYYQPVPYLTHMAQFGPRMRVATGILLLAMLNPVQVAEEVATLDVVTGGRATLGVAVGYADKEFTALGVDKADRGARFDEAIALITALWAGEPVEHEGRFFRFDGPAQASVLPEQKPRPPIWVGGNSKAAVRRAARTGDAWYAPPFPTHDALRELLAVFEEERERAGLQPAPELPIRREVIVADSKEEARRGAETRSKARYRTYLQWGLGGDLADTGGSFGEADETETSGRFFLGPPEEIAASLRRLEDEIGMTHFIFKPQWPGVPHIEAMRQLERFGTEVMAVC
ncbi:MAG: LLM class flavin-dependent oxidoreductase [Actinobacteria bacterium]|nr:LLM class flavin-dependent oxidoreductase [Actinomycetota bacterium]